MRPEILIGFAGGCIVRGGSMSGSDTNADVEAATDIYTSSRPDVTKKLFEAGGRSATIIATRRDTAGGLAGSAIITEVGAAALGAADWLCLAAAPSFAIMALITGVLGVGSPQMLCSAVQNASPLSGMVPMYVLMSAFHSAPWLKLISSRRSGAHRY